MLLGAPVSLTVWAELTGFGDSHFTFVWVNGGKKKKKKPWA